MSFQFHHAPCSYRPPAHLHLSSTQQSSYPLLDGVDGCFSPSILSMFIWAACSPCGAVITLLGGSPIAWKSSRQPFPALSTADAELIEVIESVILGGSVSCLVEEMAGAMHKVLKCDNSAAIALGSSATTRRLKVRAAHLRRGHGSCSMSPGRIWSLTSEPRS